MKNSDMKVVAIILSIALFFTIVTSNAVSIASVVFLAKGQTAQTGTAGDGGNAVTPNGGTSTTPDAGTSTTPDAGTSTTPDAGTSTTPDAGTSTTPDAGTSTTPDAGTSTTPDAGTSTTPDAGTSTTPDANKPAGDANKPAGDANKPAGNSNFDKEALAMYQKAAKEINEKGVAGYTKKSWQSIESINVGGNSAIQGLIEGFLTKEEDAEDKISEKGSEDAMRRMPPSNCKESEVASVTKKASGSNYIITIVMKDQVNPGKEDPSGLNVMSRDILYMEDVHNTVKNDSTVSKLVKSLNKGEINFLAYTITATMTKDGKFVDIVHKCRGALVADATLALNIHLAGDGVLVFNVKYWDFKY